MACLVYGALRFEEQLEAIVTLKTKLKTLVFYNLATCFKLAEVPNPFHTQLLTSKARSTPVPILPSQVLTCFELS